MKNPCNSNFAAAVSGLVSGVDMLKKKATFYQYPLLNCVYLCADRQAVHDLIFMLSGVPRPAV